MSVADIEQAIAELDPAERAQLDRWYQAFQHPTDTPDTAVPNVWQVLSDAAGTVDAPSDWASEHDHYLYGTPKHG